MVPLGSCHIPLQAEHAMLEEKYANLQDEAVGKTKKLKEVWKQFQSAKDEVSYSVF